MPKSFLNCWLHCRERYVICIPCQGCRLHLKCDGTRAETKFRLSPKRTGPFKSAGASFQSTAGSRGVRISASNAGYTTFRGSVRVLATHSIRQFPLHSPSRASPFAIRFQTHSTLPCVVDQPSLFQTTNWRFRADLYFSVFETLFKFLLYLFTKWIFNSDVGRSATLWN
jgi:hypothetical protein